jgi:hypothetical protein
MNKKYLYYGLAIVALVFIVKRIKHRATVNSAPNREARQAFANQQRSRNVDIS